VKVNIYETVEVSDADRKLIAEALGQKSATRDDLKAFIWRHGADWERALHNDVERGEAAFAASVSDDEEEQDLLRLAADLLGDLPRDEDEEDLI
jgi:hypothetical protein